MEYSDTQIHSNSSKVDIIDKKGMNPIDTTDTNFIGSSDSNRTRVLMPQEISNTFRIMAYRKSERQVRGRYRRRSYTRVFWFIMFILLYLSLIGAGIGGLLKNVSTWKRWPEFATFVAALALMMYVYYKITEVVRWCFYWLAIATIILLIINRGSLTPDDSQSPSTRIVIIILSSVEGLTLLIWIIIRYIYPRIVKDAKWLDTIWWWRIKQSDIHPYKGDAVGYFHYYAWESYSLWFRHGLVTYVGEINADGRPHGRGEWVDDSFDGECLKGIWEDGVPIGPFQARGTGTGDAFHTVRVGLVKNSYTPWDEWRFYPRPYNSGIDITVASVECSVSGKYLKHLPRSTLIFPQKFDEESNKLTMKDCLEYLTTFASFMGPDFDANDATQSSVIIRMNDEGFAITGFYPIDKTTSRNEVVIRRVPKETRNYSNIEYTLKIDGWKQSGTTSASGHCEGLMECIVFIHGFNCPSKFALETFGQFLALADFPSYIKPFVFSPPSTNSLWYFGVKKQASSEQAINDFRTFLQDLRDAGFCAVHILSHSMGCMLALQYAEAFEEIFQMKGSSKSQDSEETLMKLPTVTLLNPDTSLNQFLIHDYANLNRYCDHITIYSNERDFALKIGEFFEHDKSLGRYTCDMKCRDGKLLNVDLIDTTQLDVNMHKIRHNFFNLNRLLVDDLRDIIVFGKRAKERRTRLSRKVKGVGLEGIVYTFLVAPSYVVNK
ncbi:20368_t:CDS:2 [Funneliformis geosporum]|uniref:11688_t:CDS:1 n=1 Tax=Funneliformis geosporum TaxID=1117311 RepID=A0A9W4SCT8_9GLOM|nr:20368_t:CDS:2 [Funneliformis geosporum]CAI2163783.1 11688_t:CDS:2 [Funneliformis geosporum]